MAGSTIQEKAEHVLSRVERVGSFNLDNQNYWVKRKSERGLVLRMQKGSALDLFQQEIASLKSFHQAGVSVPQVVLESEEYFVTSDIGVSLEEEIRAADDPTPFLVQAAKAVAHMHSNSLSHGGLHMRNMCISEQGIGFLDLEKACFHEVKKSYQAYDLVVFVWSMLSIESGSTPFLKNALDSYTSVGGRAWPEAVAWCEKRSWMRLASAPLCWHERHFKQDTAYQRYAAVPLVLDFFKD